MIDIIFTLTLFIFTVISHICLHRILSGIRIQTFKTAIIFAVGLAVMFLSSGNLIYLPVTSIILYIQFSLIYLLLFTSISLNDPSPTYRILSFLGKCGKARKSTIVSEFSENEMTGRRITNLITGGYIKNIGNRYFVMPKGSRFIKLIIYYRRILGWYQGG